MKAVSGKAAGLLVALGLLAGHGGCSARSDEAPDRFTGRFLQVWTAQDVGEITSARRRDRDVMFAEVATPCRPGQCVETIDGYEIGVISYRVRINCEPVATYELDRKTLWGTDGRVLRRSTIDGDAVTWRPEGPYADLARELCAGAAPDRIDFGSFEEYRTEALTRPGMVLQTIGPPTVTRPTQ